MLYCSLSFLSLSISFPYLWILFTLNFLIVVSNVAPNPLGETLIPVEAAEYPIPALITLTSVILPWDDITGRNIAPDPDPLLSNTSNSGAEKYSNPPNWTFTELKDPLIIMGFNWASLPVCMVISGFLSRLIVLDP